MKGNDYMIYEDRKVNIFQGLVVKNYKEMCKLLNEPVTNGNSKKAQEKNWKRYFSFTKQGQRYIITEVYAEPFPSDDARKRKEGIYTKYVECLLMEILTSNSDGHALTISKNDLFETLGMVNERYHQYINNRPELVKTLNEIKDNSEANEDRNTSREITLNDVNQFYIHAGFKLNDILNSALKSMKNRFMINYRTHYMVRHQDVENGVVIDDYTTMANDTEESYILAVQKKALRNLGYSNVVEIIFKNLYAAFQKECDKIIHNETDDWLYFYPVLHIVHIPDIGKQIPLEIEELKRLTAAETKHEFNDKVVKAIDDNSQKIYEKNREKIKEYEAERDKLYGKFGEWGDPNPMNHDRPYELSSDYVETQGNLNGYLVKL